MSDSFSDSEEYYSQPFDSTEPNKQSFQQLLQKIEKKNVRFEPIPGPSKICEEINELSLSKSSLVNNANSQENLTSSFSKYGPARPGPARNFSAQDSAAEAEPENQTNSDIYNYMVQLCTIECSRLKLKNFQPFLASLSTYQLIELHETLTRTQSPKAHRCILL